MYKPLADSTLMGMTKKEIIEQLRIAEHNFKAMEETVNQQAENFIKLLAEERKHGHWIETNEYYTGAYESLYYYKCSVCGALILEDVDFGVGNYCQQCGAKMDGENNG